MSLRTNIRSAEGRPGTTSPAADKVRPSLSDLSYRNIGAIYVLIAISIFFSIVAPETFPTIATVKQILNSSAVTALAALAIVIPLSARVFDLSFAYTISLSGCVAAYMITEHQYSIVSAIVVALLVSIAVGVVNGTVVVFMRVDSFIGTLATGSLIQAGITMFTQDITVTGLELTEGFTTIGQKNYAGVTLPVLYAFLVAVAVWYLLEHTPTGRRIYATGFNLDAARLANIRVDRIRFLSLVASSFIAGIAGIVLASTIGAGSPNTGVSYLLPAYAAAFLGATQFKRGRFNAWGSIVAVILLGTGTTGLALASAPIWSPALFTGIVLITALGATGLQQRLSKRGKPSEPRLVDQHLESAHTGTSDSPLVK